MLCCIGLADLCVLIILLSYVNFVKLHYIGGERSKGKGEKGGRE